MKTRKGILIASVLLASSPVVAQIHDGVSFSGYLDLSYTSVELNHETSNEMSLDALELRFHYMRHERLSVEAHVVGDSDEDFELEQAHLNYKVNDQVSITAGKFLSIQGWEAFHASDLYQYSVSSTLVYPAMMNGVSGTYSNDNIAVYGALLSSAWDSRDTETDDMAYEVALKVNSIDNVSIHLGYTSEAFDGYDQALLNLWASYAKGPMTLAVEYNNVDDWGASNNSGEGWLVMMNYKLGDKWGLTLRTSALDVEDAVDDPVTDVSKWTISPTYEINDNWAVIFEYSQLEDESGVNTDTKAFAIESIVTF